jgi:hypothetical protein
MSSFAPRKSLGMKILFISILDYLFNHQSTQLHCVLGAADPPLISHIFEDTVIILLQKLSSQAITM